MSNQSASNHSRYIPLWHYVTSFAIALVLTGSIIMFFRTDDNLRLVSIILILISIILVIIYWYARAFALRAQDRAIRAEENFRHFILTGRPLPKELRMGQIVALRFASDEEFPSLTQQAVSEKLSQKQIKLAIKNWKPDYNRV
jgi:hypothetical protein